MFHMECVDGLQISDPSPYEMSHD